MRRYARPAFGSRVLQTITTDDIADHLAGLRSTLAGSTLSTYLAVLSQSFSYAANTRRGWIQINPCKSLERSERPKPANRERRTIPEDDLRRLLEGASEPFGTLIMLLAYSGLRISEALGLRWSDVDFEAGFISPRFQYDREGKPGPLKTANSYRSVVLAPQLAKALREHRLRSLHSGPGDFVFPNATGDAADALRKRTGLLRPFDRPARSERKQASPDPP